LFAKVTLAGASGFASAPKIKLSSQSTTVLNATSASCTWA
jgi:hypothetical protein